MTSQGWRSLNLNDDQREAVEHAGGPLIVLAGPGTGKTRVIIARVARLLEDGADPESVVALTFTVKAAQEMRRRIGEIVEPTRAARVRMGTFHSFGAKFVRQFSDVVGLPPTPVLADSSQERALLARVIDDNDLFTHVGDRGRDALVDRCRDFVSMCRQHARFPEDALTYASEWDARADKDEREVELSREFAELARAYSCYESACRAGGTLTIDEYLTLPIRLLRESDHAASVVRGGVRHVVVDEFQDVNGSQIEMLRLLAPPRDGVGPDVAVVGDDDQSIYAFRGSSQRAFERFEGIWGAAHIVELRDNYRNADPIQHVSSAFIQATPASARFKPDKTLRCGVRPDRDQDKGGAGPVEGITFVDEDLYPQAIVAMMHADRQRERNAERPPRPWKSYGIIARGHTMLQRAARVLELNEVPYRYAPGERAGEHPVVEDLLALLRLVADPTDAHDAVRLMRRPPLLAPTAELASLHAHFRKEARRGRLTRGFPEWVSDQGGACPECRRAGRMLATWLAELRTLDASATPDQVALRAIELMGWATVAPGEARERAAAISALATAVRFIHARLPRLEAPANLHAFWSYYDRLDDDDKAMQSLDDERLGDDAGDDDDDGPDAVTLLTAHKAKGLEFDTVFVLRVRSPHGFPTKRGSDEDTGIAHLLPADFTGEAGDDDDTSEERRLFYVAMTRAERRLVLMAKHKKSKTKDFFIEVMDDLGGDAVVARTSDEVLDDEEAQLGSAVDALRRDAERDIASPLAWRDAHRRTLGSVHALLAQLEQRASDPGAAASSLALAGRRLAFLGALRDEGEADPALLDPADRTWGEELVAALHDAPRGEYLFAPLEPPLELSYTKIDQYLRCPRCFYAKHVLRLPEPASIHLVMGNVAHSALEDFFMEYREAVADSRLPPGLTRLRELAQAALRRRPIATHLLDQFDERRMNAMLAQAHDALHQPGVDAGYEILELERDFPEGMELPISTRHTISGKIDRFDRIDTPQGLRYRIVDYKTGKAREDLVTPSPTDLQLGIYSMAASMQAGNDPLDPLPGTAEYWVLATGEAGRIDLADLDLRAILATIEEVVAGMTEGRFEPKRNCKGICRFFGLNAG